MSYKIVVDSCCELPEELKHDPRYEIVPLTLIVGDSYERLDDDGFDQKEFLQAVAECPVSPRSACPSPEKYMEAYRTDADHVYVVTLSSKLSGSYNSAVLGKNLYHETYGEKQIYVVDSRSASCGETQIAMQIARWEDEGMGYEEITEKIEKFTDGMHTYFVLDNLDTLRKNGRLSGVKALVASTLSIKPVMAGDQGSIVQLGQSVGIKKALAKMVDYVVRDVVDAEKKCLMITHCNNPERANSVKEQILAKVKFKDVLIMDTAGISSMYANDGGVIVTA
ncbi:MAG: DegV family protein [Lachnospiraceae bacterium]|nr:DegV family protein [Lachnospiraceae bacterium]